MDNHMGAGGFAWHVVLNEVGEEYHITDIITCICSVYFCLV